MTNSICLNQNVVSKIHYLHIPCTQIEVDPLREKSQKHIAQSKARGLFLGKDYHHLKEALVRKVVLKIHQSITSENAIMIEVGLKAIMK